MANITNYLNKIKTAVYGKDVRGAIHDAIKECYDDASVNHDNANMEVKMARGTHNTLNDRLDKSEQKLDETNTQLFELDKKTNWIIPDEFDGDDSDKIQSSINKAIELGRLGIPKINIIINRVYEVETTINIDKDFNPKFVISLKGEGNGAIVKTTPGFLFSSTLGLRNGQIRIDGIVFKGKSGCGLKLFDCDSLLGIQISNCDFFDVDTCCYAYEYIQTLRFYNNTIFGGNGTFIDANQCYDVSICDNQFEQRNGTNIRISRNKRNSAVDCNVLRIQNNLMESLTGGVAIVFGIANGVYIEGNYFEANVEGDIKDDVVSGENHTTVCIRNNMTSIGVNGNGSDNYFCILSKGSPIIDLTNNKVSNRKGIKVNCSVVSNNSPVELSNIGNHVKVDNKPISSNLSVTKEGNTAIFKSKLIKVGRMDITGSAYIVHLVGTTGSGYPYRDGYTYILKVSARVQDGKQILIPKLTKLTTDVHTRDNVTAHFINQTGEVVDNIDNTDVWSESELGFAFKMPYTYGYERGTMVSLDNFLVAKGIRQPL